MSTIKDGGPAFPVPGLQHDEDFNGMSMRDYFASKAMIAVLAPNPVTGQFAHVSDFNSCADVAYRMADAMLAAREQNGNNQ